MADVDMANCVGIIRMVTGADFFMASCTSACMSVFTTGDPPWASIKGTRQPQPMILHESGGQS